MAVNYKSGEIFEQVVEQYAAPLLGWAFRKTGDGYEAEELAQEVLLQILTAIKQEADLGRSVDKLENYIWRIARYVWCRRLRDDKYGKSGSFNKIVLSADTLDIPDENDFAGQLAEKEETDRLLSHMRSRIAMLNHLQREIMISFYLEEKSIREISRSLGISESSVKWYLYDTRNKLREEISTMKTDNFLYRPRRLHMGISGQAVPVLDTKTLESSLSKQNICISCYAAPKSPQELAEQLGIPQAYLEDDLQWLAEKEFITEKSGRYATSFLIENTDDEQAKYAVYVRHKSTLSDVIVGELLKSEEAIRSIGFAGCGRPMEKMRWWLIYRFSNTLRLPLTEAENLPSPLRPDGGRYFPLGFDRTDPPASGSSLDTSGWAYNGSMSNDGFHWFGLYDFGRSEIEDILDGYTEENRLFHNMLKDSAKAPLSLDAYDENGRFLLSRLVQKGFLQITNGLAHPTFTVLTAGEEERLEREVFAPIAEKLAGELESFIADLRRLCKNRLPVHLRDKVGLQVNMAAGDIAYVTTIFAFHDGRLYIPVDSHDGEFLTFLYTEQ